MRRAYAADFGAGNTCLYTTKPNVSLREATPLNTPGGEPSGYALDNRGGVSLGLGLYSLTFSKLEQIERFHINLKAQPTEENREELIYYFRSWLEKMERDYPEQFRGVDQKYWFIGCPTGVEWKKKETQDFYKGIFEEAGFENAYIVPESNAALAFYQKTDHILDDYSADTKLVLIDQGAYSLDVTRYSGGEITSYGGYLGASLVERMLIHVILYSDEESIRLRKRMINLPATVEEARALYEQEGANGKFYTYLLLQARKLKEEYFSAIKSNTLVKTADVTRTLDFAVDDDPLNLFVNPKMMEMILEKMSVRQVLGAEFDTLAPEVRREIGDKTWMETFCTFLDRVDQAFPDLRENDHTIIMMTGGGSLMDCVVDAVRTHYRQASVHCDPEAIAAIGKGLAYWAPDKILAMDFENAFWSFINKKQQNEDGDSTNIVFQKLSTVFAECTAQLTKDIIEEENNAVMYGIGQWRVYNCDRDSIPHKIEQHMRDWVQNTGMPSFVSNIDRHISNLKTELNVEFNQETAVFQIDQFELLKEEDPVFLSNSKMMLPRMFDVIVDCIAGYYNKNKNWSEFPNDKKKLFSDIRDDFYNTIINRLHTWLDNEKGGTIEWCRSAFGEMEFEIGNDFKCTLWAYFCMEGCTDMLNLMKKHVKEILGKLVLEEYLEDGE